jgi:hypothetical protein
METANGSFRVLAVVVDPSDDPPGGELGPIRDLAGTRTGLYPRLVDGV